MRILVYGAGVLGCELAHVLMQNKKNVVTLLARGEWKEMIDQKGLVIRHWVQRKTTTERIKTVDTLAPDDYYDLVFVVVQAGQLPDVLPVLKANKSQYEACLMLKDAGIPVNYANNTDNFQPGTSARRKMEAMVFTMTKTSLGRLCVSDHAMHAVSEMKYLDEAFDALRRQTGTAMPMWEKLRNEMPSWDSLQQNRKAAK